MITCCEIALVLGITNVVSLAIFAGYNVKFRNDQVLLKKEIQEVERVNGKEKKAIKQLQEKLLELETKLIKHEAK